MDENCRTSAEKTVKDIDGVKSVVNNIQIAQVQVTDDAALKSSAEQVAAKYSGVQADVAAGVITLRGTIDDREKLQQLMMDLNALRPQRIDNQLVIKNK
jgi:hyperosmotically inducible protein